MDNGYKAQRRHGDLRDKAETETETVEHDYAIALRAQFAAFLRALHDNLKEDDALSQGGLNGQNFLAKRESLLPQLTRASAWIVLQQGVADHKMAVFREAIDAGQSLAGLEPAERHSPETRQLPTDAQALRTAAERSYRLALDLDADCANAAFNLASLREDAGDHAAAQALYERAAADPFYRPHVLMRLGLARAQSGDIQGAAHLLREAISLFPHFGQHHHRIAGILREAGLIDEALAEYGKTIETVHYYAPEFILSFAKDLTGR